MTTSLHNISMLEASSYLNLPANEFLDYLNRGLICYRLVERNRLFTRQELNRFKQEVLDIKKKL